MSGWLFVFACFAAVNPPAAMLAGRGSGGGRVRQALLAFGFAAAIVLVAAAAAEAALDWLEVEPESFRTAAGIVMAVQGARTAWDPRPYLQSQPGRLPGLVPLGWPTLASAATIVLVISYSADEGAGPSVVGMAAALAVGAIAIAAPSREGPAVHGLARLLGALLVVSAAALVVSGIRDV